jgi:stearoyl-CoA desaturase (delta-9 desaturase)
LIYNKYDKYIPVLNSKEFNFDNDDDSRNSLFIALITLGEGWHNNHHKYQASARQGFYWWEIDISYYLIRLMGLLGIVHNIRAVPDKVYEQAAGRVAP